MVYFIIFISFPFLIRILHNETFYLFSRAGFCHAVVIILTFLALEVHLGSSKQYVIYSLLQPRGEYITDSIL